MNDFDIPLFRHSVNDGKQAADPETTPRQYKQDANFIPFLHSQNQTTIGQWKKSSNGHFFDATKQSTIALKTLLMDCVKR